MVGLNKKIWIVDDDTDLSRIYSEKFREEGFEVKTFADGQGAWESFQAGNAPDLVFAGILMSKMTGFQLIEKLRTDEKLKSLPTVIFSHRGRQEDKITAQKLGVDDFIVQGAVPLVEVVRRIKFVLGIKETYKVKLDPDKFDDEALINFLIKQSQLDFRAEDRRKKIYLVLEPELEKGKFKIQLSVED